MPAVGSEIARQVLTVKENLQRLGDLLAALDHVRQYLKGYRFHLSHRFFLAGSIGHYPWKVRRGSQDSSILLPFQFDADRLNFNHGYPIVAGL